jgi:hypothetical protein
MNKTIESLGAGLLRVLCYSYGGFLLVVCAACFSHEQTAAVIDALHPSVAILAIIVIGAAIHVLHRSIVMPIHHALLCFLFRLGDKARGSGEHAEFSPDPTRYLGEGLGVPIRRRMTAYNILRRSDFFPNKDSLNIAHAENGLLVMSGVGLVIAAGYALSRGSSFGLALVLFVLAVVFLAASFWAEWIQHSVECSIIKDRPVEAMKILANTGILRTEDIKATMVLQNLRDNDAPDVWQKDTASHEQTSDLDST